MQQGPPRAVGPSYTRLPAQMPPPVFYHTPYGYMPYPNDYAYQQGMYNPQIGSHYYQQMYGSSSSSAASPQPYPYPYMGYTLQSPRPSFQSPFQGHRPPYIQYHVPHMEGNFTPSLPYGFQLQAPPNANQSPNTADSQTPQHPSSAGANTDQSPDG